MSLQEILQNKMDFKCVEDLIAELEYEQENSCELYLANRFTKDYQRHQIDFIFWSILLEKVREEANK